MDFLQVFPIHRCKQYISECCDLINSEWPRSKEARFQSLYMSCEKFPASLVLILNDAEVVGHCKITEIKKGGPDVIIESVIIDKKHRGKGWGKILMEDAEKYAMNRGKKTMYLSTKGQEGFYEKLGYEVCKPINYFGFTESNGIPDDIKENNDKNNEENRKSCVIVCSSAPPPPPLPPQHFLNPLTRESSKTFMKKLLDNEDFFY